MSCQKTSRGYADEQDGSIDIAVDAIKAAGSGHTFLSVTKQGLSAIVETHGNNSTHVILRGSSKGPNYEAEHVEACSEKLKKAGLIPKIMVSIIAVAEFEVDGQVDCSHGNSSKQFQRQIVVGENIVCRP
jgi:3-deoxy-7-phosphoheptulonate synthase